MLKENIKKFKKIAVLAGGVFVLSGCGVSNVGETVEISNSKDEKFSEITSSIYEKPEIEDEIVTTSINNVVTTSSEVISNNTVTTIQTEAVSLEPEEVISIDFEEPSENVVTVDDEELVTVDSSESYIIDDGWDTFSCDFYKSMYSYVDEIDSYVIKAEDTIEDISNECNFDKAMLYQYNPDFDNYSVGDVVKYPVIKEFYKGKRGQEFTSIYYETGISADYIKELNNIPSDQVALSEDTSLLIHVNKGANMNYPECLSYETEKGISNEVYGNKIYGDKLIFASGYPHASQDLLVLNCYRQFPGQNVAIYYQFDGAGNYKSRVVASNVSDIGMIDGIPVAYVRTQNDIDYLTVLYDIAADDSYKLATINGDMTVMGTASDGRKIVTYDTKVNVQDMSAISGVSLVKKR